MLKLSYYKVHAHRMIIVGRSVEQLVRDRALWVNLVRVASMEERVDPNTHLLAGNITLIRIGNSMRSVYSYFIYAFLYCR